MLAKKKRIQNRRLLDSYHLMRCCECGREGCDPAHAKSKGSGGDDIKENVIPLCRKHHTEQHKIGVVTFAKKYPKVMMWYLTNGWELININGKEKFIYGA